MRMNFSDPQMDNCITDCLNCYRACLRALSVNVNDMERREPMSNLHVQILNDCAKICSTSADFMIRSSPRHNLTCGICATICEVCATECDKMMDDEMMRNCANMCRQCAQSCYHMSQQMMV